MICPYCNGDAPLTWWRYFRATFGKYNCPQCHRVSRFGVTKTYVAVYLGIWISLFLVVSALIMLTTDDRIDLAVMAMIYLGLLFLPVDKLCDEVFLDLRPISKNCR